MATLPGYEAISNSEKHFLTIQISEHIHEHLSEMAAEWGCTIPQYVNGLIEDDWCNSDGTQEAKTEAAR